MEYEGGSFNYENLSAKETIEKLDVSPKQGLDEEEVEKRQQHYGLNKIEEEKKNPILKFLSHF